MKLSVGDEQRLYDRVFDFESSRRLFAWSIRGGPTATNFTDNPDGTLRYWVQLLCFAEQLWPLEDDDFERDSVQLRIMKAASEMEEASQVKQRFESARSGAWRLVVNQAERLLLGTDKPNGIPFEHRNAAYQARGLVENRHWLNQGRLTWQSITKSEPLLLKYTIKQLERQPGPTANRISLIIGQLWVDPDYPLWLMQSDPAWRVAEAFNSAYEDTPDVTEENFNRIKRSYSLNSFAKAPITELKLFRSQKKDDPKPRFEGYILSGKFREIVKKLPVPRLPGFEGSSRPQSDI